ncbi:MAG TPA: hypothetical protein VGO40_05255 [Longimicrobium sp.]|jgi:hypothetical protein|nr:hypothetical protein [Longimicrobium sp.]
MKLFRYAAPAVVLLALSAAKASAQATQDVALEVQAINQLSFTGSPSLTISTATAGSAPTSATANASYAVTTNETNRKVTAQIDADTPSGVTLSASLAAPSGATSAGAVQLGTTAQDVVTGIGTVNASGLNVTYTLSATAAAGVVPSTSRTVTYTITAGA